jgi:ABC-type glycerol-3-phosphate transport system substrate-binding protein
MMKISRRKFMQAVGVAAATGMLSACGNSAAASTASSAASSTASTASGEKTTISFINGFTGGDGPFMTKIVKAFNDSQSQYYVDELQDADEYTKFKSDNFDMLVIHSDWISTYHAMGLLRDCTDIYEAAGLSFEKDFHPITQTFAKYDDGVFGFPLDLYAETCFYNKKYFPEAPKSYDDLAAMRDANDSVNSGIYPFSLPLTGDHQWAWMTALGQTNCTWDNGEYITMASDVICDAFMKVHDMIYKDHLSAPNLGDNDHFNTFVNNSETASTITAGMCLTGPWNYTAAKEVLGDDLGVATIPQIYGDTVCVPAGGHNFAVSAKVTDEDKLAGIAAFMKFAFQPKIMLNWADSGQAPIHLATMELVKADPTTYPVANVNYGIFDYAKILPAIYNIREQVKYVNETVWSLVLQTEDLSRDDLMEELQNATDTAKELSEM